MAQICSDVKIKDVMASQVVAVPPFARAEHALDLMLRHCFRHLLVVENNHLIGVITLADILGLQASGAFQRLTFADMLIDLEQNIVASMMTTSPVTVSELDNIEHALRLMSEHRCSGLPVINDDGDIAGLITESDIVELVSSQW